MRGIQLVNIGFGNTVSAERIIAVVSPESSPIKRLVTEARESSRLIDATYGRKTRAVIVCDNGSVVLSSVQPDTVANRITDKHMDYNPSDAESDIEDEADKEEENNL